MTEQGRDELAATLAVRTGQLLAARRHVQQVDAELASARKELDALRRELRTRPRVHPGESWWWPTSCSRCDRDMGPWNPDVPGSPMTHIRVGGGPDWVANKDHDATAETSLRAARGEGVEP